MNPAPRPPAPSAADTAALWAARLDGSVLTREDRIALDAWLAADPAHRALLSEFCQLSADLEQRLPSLTGIRERPADNTAALVNAQPSPWLRWPRLAGVALTAAAAVALGLWLAGPGSRTETLETPAGQRRAVALADGSQLELNAGTRLEVALDGTERRARLASGQVFFTVARDAARPFVVETPGGTVRVTGTAFDVRTGPAATLEVTVAEGSVQVRPGGEARLPAVDLGVGDRLVATDGNTSVRSLPPAGLAAALAWRQGQVVFQGETLAVALEQLARHHGRTIAVAPGAATLRIGGRFALDDLDGFLVALEATLPVDAKRSGAGAIEVVRRPDPTNPAVRP